MFIAIEWVEEEPKHDYTSMWTFEDKPTTPKRLGRFNVPDFKSDDPYYLEQLDEFRKRMLKRGIIIK